MKILVLSDIHSDYVAARSAYDVENPDFVLDCGDHQEVKNLFELTPHFYIFGNHEPSTIYTPLDGMPVPVKIPSGVILCLKKNDLEVRVAGIDGNYAKKSRTHVVDQCGIDKLKSIPKGGVDIILTHESPLLVSENSDYRSLAKKVISEIERINPCRFFSGHYNNFMDSLKTPKGIKNIVLDDMAKGYCLLDGETLEVTRKRARFR